MLRKILFVDDDQILRCAVEKHLATYSEHFIAVTAVDGFDAVKKLQKMPFSLIVLDLVMPRMDGMSLVGHIRDKYTDIPIIIISGMPLEKMRQLAATSGIVAYLSKPFQADELVATIMHTLRQEAEAGIMHDVSPAVFLQFMEMDAKTCTIRILDKASKQGGILYFIDGQLVDARIGELKGMDAALKVFTWDAATIFLRNDCQPRQDTINSGLQPIIMKAAGMKDESDDTPFDDEKEDPATPSNGDSALDDLDLPDDFSAPASFRQPLDDLPSLIDEEEEEMIPSPFHVIRNLLAKEAGIHCSRKDIHHDQAMTRVVSQLNELAAGLQLGKFQVGYIAGREDSDRILLPGPPTTVVDVQANSPRDKILRILRTGNRKP